jgi:hypothetical protein
MVVKSATLALVGLALGLTIAVAAFPSFAESNRANTRAQAIQDCSAEAAKYSEHTWGVAEVTTYRSCMTRHGQPE